jgi:hypothetical protein
MPPLTPRPGTDGNLSCGYWGSSGGRGLRRSFLARMVALYLFMDDSALHAAGDRYDLASDMP